MMSLTSSVTSPPKSIVTVESGCEPASAVLGVAVKSSIEKAASAGPGDRRTSSAAATTAPADRIAPARQPLLITLDIGLGA